MKLGTARYRGQQHVVLAVGHDTHAMLLDVDLTMQSLIEDWAVLGPRVAAMAAAGPDKRRTVQVTDLEWLPPVPRPGKVICLALNNSANVSRIMSGPEHPATFTKPATSLLGHGQPIRLKKEYGRVHPEPELAVVVGAGGTGIPAGHAFAHIFGYTVINDLTSPTMRSEDTFHYRAIHPAPDGSQGIKYVDTWVSYPGRYKGADGFGPIGPWVATADSVRDPHALTVSCVHQGRLVTEDSTANLLHKVPDVITFLSSYTTLEPGDIIAMGTALKPSASGGSAIQNINLVTLGGPIEITISGIGTLSNPVELL